jgi:hypothetical protein
MRSVASAFIILLIYSYYLSIKTNNSKIYNILSGGVMTTTRIIPQCEVCACIGAMICTIQEQSR